MSSKLVIVLVCLSGLLAVGCSTNDATSPGLADASPTSEPERGATSTPSPPASILDDAGADAAANASADASADAAPAPPSTLCRDARADAWTLPLTKASSGGSFQVTLKSAVPAPARVGANAWTLVVTDAAGKAITGAEGALTAVTTWMPDHGHGSAAPTLVESTPGSYLIDPVQLFMGGYWEVKATVTATGKTETATFGYCVRTVP